ncbi:hypothetical protein H7F51_08045 [Novosphingobium flavum]|uniref:Uncharacterized protein n=1 Tax=Novosphingobium flavum TaxID=1778672 RepID=A0A7X1FR60_9SPHN|nr:hypothetical protein [Novosphingobium flavum]MBC2665470.1 hypothetical protein [Novosphingobium flavum]
MGVTSRIWVPAASVQPQERGPDYFAPVDGAPWSEGSGFYRGFFSAFRLRGGKDAWFHFPIPAIVEQDGQTLHLTELQLMWEVLDGARLSWATLQHGGMERVELIPRLTSPDSIAVPADIPAEARPWHPQCDRRLSTFTLERPLPLRFGIQLCVMASAAETDGTVRFFGAGARLTAG